MPVTSAEQILAGPIVRRVATDRVSVWVALAVPSQVTLSIFAHAHGVSGATATPLHSHTEAAKQIGAELHIALVTVALAAGSHLEPGELYDYDLGFDGKSLGQLGLLQDGEIAGHKHVALGYVQGVLPAFRVPPRDAADLVIAHGSCRRPYAEGYDGLVALDQIIERGREPAPGRPRPHYMFMTGDQIYADDLSNEMLAWASEGGVRLVGINGDGDAVEELRVELPYTREPANRFTRTARFPADRNHFPMGRRARLAARAAALTSDDNQNHALSFGEIAMHYLMSWSNVKWPRLDDPQVWSELFAQRGAEVREYVTAWLASFATVRDSRNQHKIADEHYEVSGKADLFERVEHLDGWRLLPAKCRGIDRFAAAIPEDWGKDGDAHFEAWKGFWFGTTNAPPVPATPQVVAATSGVAADLFSGTPDDLRDLANLMTPAWYAGKHHFAIGHAYRLDKQEPPVSADAVELDDDAVVVRLQRLRTFYQGLPYARRALANVSTLMMFDDHEVTDDWTTTLDWVVNIKKRALGRDVITNALAAYLLFQDWGNDHTRYADDSPNTHALDTVLQMFFDDNHQLRAHGPPEDVRERLERLFGFAPDAQALPVPQQVAWNFGITDRSVAPYEILLLDNRTKRGYDTPDAPPADLSLEAIATQVPPSPPAGSAVSIVIAPLPVVGYPPMEQMVQPLFAFRHSLRKSPDPDEAARDREVFPEIDLDYAFGSLLEDPEAWGFNTPAQEALLARLSSRAAVVFLSGDIHFALTGKVTYWRSNSGVLEPAARFVQLISSALKNVPGPDKSVFAQLAVAEQLGAVISGPYDRLGWTSGGVDGPNFDPTGGSYQLEQKMRENPAVIPLRMLPDAVLTQVRTRSLARPPEWAWRFDLVKDVRSDADRYGPMLGAAASLQLPTEADLAASRTAAIRQIAQQHVWNARNGIPRRVVFYTNLGLVEFERADASSPLAVVHSLYGWDRSNLGPGGGAATPNVPWPIGRLGAHPYTQYRVSFDLTDELAPDREDPTEPRS